MLAGYKFCTGYLFSAYENSEDPAVFRCFFCLLNMMFFPLVPILLHLFILSVNYHTEGIVDENTEQSKKN